MTKYICILFLWMGGLSLHAQDSLTGSPGGDSTHSETDHVFAKADRAHEAAQPAAFDAAALLSRIDKLEKDLAAANEKGSPLPYILIGGVSVLLLLSLIFFMLRRQIDHMNDDINAHVGKLIGNLEHGLSDQISGRAEDLHSHLNHRVDKEIVQYLEMNARDDSGLLSAMDSHIDRLLEQQVSQGADNVGAADHELIIKVADELSRIHMNLRHMDPDIKGYKQLDRAVRAITNNFSAYGYEIPDLIEQPFDPGANMTATMEPDENLESGVQVIRRVIRPQIAYKGTLIQTAEVVVAYGE